MVSWLTGAAAVKALLERLHQCAWYYMVLPGVTCYHMMLLPVPRRLAMAPRHIGVIKGCAAFMHSFIHSSLLQERGGRSSGLNSVSGMLMMSTLTAVMVGTVNVVAAACQSVVFKCNHDESSLAACRKQLAIMVLQ
jgi:hypothetical protein